MAIIFHTLLPSSFLFSNNELSESVGVVVGDGAALVVSGDAIIKKII